MGGTIEGSSERDIDPDRGVTGVSGPGTDSGERESVLRIFLVALRLGCVAFGGPLAHFAYFENEYVQRRGWLDHETFADLVALSQVFPGAGSSKVAMAIGIMRRGMLGGFAAWLGFALPSAVLLTAFAWTASRLTEQFAGWLNGLVVVAVPVVALAVWKLWRQLAPDRTRSSMVVLATAALLAFPSSARTTIVAVIVAGGILGWFLLRGETPAARSRELGAGRPAAVVSTALFVGLLVALPVLRAALDSHAVDTADAFYGSGALVFGGAPVVLPLLEGEVVESGWIDEETFLAGFGAAQAIPGPIFTFAAYIGFSMGPEPNGLAGAALALAANYLPSFLIVVATLPSFGALRSRPGVQAVLAGVNAVVVGILLSALYDPLWSSAIRGPADFGLALVAFLMLAFWKLPPWLVVIITAAAGALMAAI